MKFRKRFKQINITLLFSSIIVFIIIMISDSCNVKVHEEEDKVTVNNDHLIMSVLWHQRAAEAMAVYYQAYNLARLRLDDYLEKNDTSNNPAIVVDIDETVLDNSPYEWKVIDSKKGYPEGWWEWTHLGIAEPIPGAVDFLNYAASKGVVIFYLSNRKTDEIAGTSINLKRHNFPMVDDEHILLKEKYSSKEGRRKSISDDHEIVLLIGDNLRDFDEMFANKSLVDRYKLVDKHKEDFGNKFIMVPNAMYGDWLGAIYNYNWKLSPELRDSVRRSKLIQYNKELSWTISEVLVE